MAKMFYTLEEAAERLGMSTDDVQQLAESGQLQEFRDRDSLMFKVDQVDLLAGDDDEDGDDEISLADTGGGIEPMSLSSSGSGGSIGLDASGEGTGISIFDPEEDEGADANAETLVSGGLGAPSMGGSGFGMDAGASGSGLSQLAFEPDDTSLGGNLLDDLDNDGGSQVGSLSGASALGESALGAPTGGALFEGDDAADDSFKPSAAGAPAAFSMPTEIYDGPASGLFGGIALGAVVTLLISLAVMVLGLNGGSEAVLGQIDQNIVYGVAGGSVALMLIMGVIGWVLLRRS